MNVVPIAKIKSEKNILGADWCGRKLSAAGKTSQVRKNFLPLVRPQNGLNCILVG
jgi:hypothetical protein